MAVVAHDVSSIRWFEEIGIEDIPLVGGKNASRGEMYRELAPRGVQVPNGFAITADAYREFLRVTKIGICGQAPSDYPEFTKFLVEQGIDSISLNPDAAMKTTAMILELEQSVRR